MMKKTSMKLGLFVVTISLKTKSTATTMKGQSINRKTVIFSDMAIFLLPHFDRLVGGIFLFFVYETFGISNMAVATGGTGGAAALPPIILHTL